MTTQDDPLTINSKVKTYLEERIIPKKKIILVIGGNECGKTSLIKFFSGSTYTVETNQQGIGFLKEKSKSEVQPELFKYGTMQQQVMAIYNTANQESDSITIIEMPSIIELNKKEDEQHNPILILNKILLTANVWNIVLNLVQNIHICVVTPIQVFMQDAKLLQFFQKLYQLFNDDECTLKKLENCISIIVAKADYEDDIQIALQKLTNLTHSEIGHKLIFKQIINKRRVYCFLADESSQGDGSKLLDRILEQNQFENTNQFELMKSHWQSVFIEIIADGTNFYQSTEVVTNLQQIYKVFLSSEKKNYQIFNKCFTTIGISLTSKFIKCIKNEKELNQLYVKLIQSLKINMNSIPIEYKNMIDGNLQSDYLNSIENYFQILLNINTLLTQQQSTVPIYQALINDIGSQFGDNNKLVLKKWLNLQLFMWRIVGQFEIIYSKYKDNHKDDDIKQNMIKISSLDKQIISKLKKLTKKKIKDSLQKLQLFEKLNNIKSIKDIEKFQKIVNVFKENEEEIDQVMQQQQKETMQVPQIKRWFYPTDPKGQLFPLIRERANKMNYSMKIENEVKREEIKDLLNWIQKQKDQQKKNINICELGNKFKKYQFYQHTLQALMEANYPQELYNFLTSSYFRHVEDSEQKIIYVKFIGEELIKYLEYKVFIYKDWEKAKLFFYCLQACYDFLASNFAQSGEQFNKILDLSNEVVMPTQGQQIEIADDNEIFPKNQQTQSKDMFSLQYVNLSKAQILEEFNNRQELKKKKMGLLTQKKKCYLAAKQFFKFQ